MNNYDLFDNPMVREAKKNMSEEDIEMYKRKGEALYGSIDFESVDPVSITNEALSYIECQLRSGMHPSYLESDELELLRHECGEEWYKKWGYTENDLNKINI